MVSRDPVFEAAQRHQVRTLRCEFCGRTYDSVRHKAGDPCPNDGCDGVLSGDGPSGRDSA
jgi:hypothetical protein